MSMNIAIDWKAQFGTAVWLNGKSVGEHLGSFTAGHFDLTGAINWKGENRSALTGYCC